MKKVLAVILSAAMVLSMSACGSKPKDARTVYEEAVKKNNELTAMDMTSTMDMTMSADGQSIDMSVDMDIVMDKINTDQMVYYADMTSSSQGQEVPMTLFYTNGYYYIESAGQKIKYAMDLTELMEQVKQNTQNQNLSADSMKELSVKQDGDNQILTFTIDPEKMDAYVQQAMAGVTGAAGAGDASIKINSGSGEYTINKEGYYTATKLTMDMDTTSQGQTVNIVMNMNGTVNNPGQPVTVTLPSTEGYEEVDPAAMQPAA